VGFVAAADVADVAAQLLTGPVPAGGEPGVFTLTGPDSLSYPQVATRISAVFARQVRYADLPEERAREELLGSGLAPWDAEGMLELFAWIRAGGAGQLTQDVREVTRHAPRGTGRLARRGPRHVPGAPAGRSGSDVLAPGIPAGRPFRAENAGGHEFQGVVADAGEPRREPAEDRAHLVPSALARSPGPGRVRAW